MTSPDLAESKETDKASEAMPVLIEVLGVSSAPPGQREANMHTSPKAPQTDEPCIPLDVIYLTSTALPREKAINVAVGPVEVSSVLPEACAKSVLSNDKVL